MSEYIGVDIGGTKCAVVAGNADGSITSKDKFATGIGPVPTLDRIQSAIGAILESEHPKAIGISCGGPLDSSLGIIKSPPNLPGWDNIGIKDVLESAFGLPVFLQNDANACALAEYRFGAGKGTRNMVFLTFGTGLGSGIILDGRLYEGTNGMAGEVGHIRLADDGPVGYGKEGSFEGFCSGGGIAQLAKDIVRKRLAQDDPVSFLPDSGVNSITARIVGQAAEAGDKLAQSILGLSGRWLGKGLSIIIDILNPEVIVIGSVFARSRKFLQPPAEEVIRAEALSPAAAVCRIEPAGLGEKIGDIAALSVGIDGLEHS
ncbi:MAG: ROK family protein [Spirochaetales bacterium]|jgi:glucokinase|nr:ROK family protein [Spirochaetales bacterium]